jgi:hypothetical protein
MLPWLFRADTSWPPRYFWIDGTTRLQPEYQAGQTALHRAVAVHARQPALLAELLAADGCKEKYISNLSYRARGRRARTMLEAT